MTPLYRKWKVSGYMRAVMDQVPRTDEWVDTREREPVVVVSDPDGTVWEVTAENGQLTSLTVRGAISQRSLAHVPLLYLLDVATTYLDTVQRGWDSGARLEDALREADIEQGKVVHSKETNLANFATVWKATPARRITDAGTKATPRRELLADHFGVSVYTIDNLTKRAREAELIPAATTGRGNTKATDAKRASATERKPK
jgi:hypothetical protein